MSKKPDFDLQAAHKYFSAECFNRAWDLIKKVDRTPQEDEEMIRLSLTSTYHWTQRTDCTPTNLSVGYWQSARIHTILGNLENARFYGLMCLEVCQSDDVPAWAKGFAYESLARAEMSASDWDMMAHYLSKARELADQEKDPENRKILLADLETIKRIK